MLRCALEAMIASQGIYGQALPAFLPSPVFIDFVQAVWKIFQIVLIDLGSRFAMGQWTKLSQNSAGYSGQIVLIVLIVQILYKIYYRGQHWSSVLLLYTESGSIQAAYGPIMENCGQRMEMPCLRFTQAQEPWTPALLVVANGLWLVNPF